MTSPRVDPDHPSVAAPRRLNAWQAQRLRSAGAGLTRYRLVDADNALELERVLDELAAEGWHLVGPVAPTFAHDGRRYLLGTLTRTELPGVEELPR